MPWVAPPCPRLERGRLAGARARPPLPAPPATALCSPAPSCGAALPGVRGSLLLSQPGS